MKIAICGLGKAGKEMARYVVNSKEHELKYVVCRDSSGKTGKDVGTLLDMYELNNNVIGISEARNVLEHNDVDVLIDFSHKDISTDIAKMCADKGIGVVICTTNFSDEELKTIRQIGENSKAGLVYAPNLTIGINLLMEFVERISKILLDFDFEIVERHRKDKKRITTTAKMIASRIHRDEVPISSVRVGGYVGVHEVTAANENERLTIIHESFSRNAFVNGALLAANYIVSKQGYYEMTDVVKELEKNIIEDVEY